MWTLDGVLARLEHCKNPLRPTNYERRKMKGGRQGSYTRRKELYGFLKWRHQHDFLVRLGCD